MKDVLHSFSVVCLFILGISVIRAMYNVDPLNFTTFLYILSTVDLDFNFVIRSFADISNLTYVLSDISIISVQSFFDFIYQYIRLLLSFLAVPFSLLIDLSQFLVSVIGVFVQLIGFNPFVSG